jgi:hypothetical protein
MRILRTILFIYAGLCIAGAVILFNVAGAPASFLAGYLLINSIVIVGALIFEKHRYQPGSSSTSGWQATGERFVDPTTQKLIEVHYNPKTGERDYKEIRSK